MLAGPWGYCVSLNVPVANGAEQNCLSVGALRDSAKVIMHWGSLPTEPRWIVGTAKPDVAYLRLTLAGGTTTRVAVSDVSGQRFYAIEIGRGPSITGWGAFNAAERPALRRARRPGLGKLAGTGPAGPRARRASRSRAGHTSAR